MICVTGKEALSHFAEVSSPVKPTIAPHMSAMARNRMRRSSSSADVVLVTVEDANSDRFAFDADNLGSLAHEPIFDSPRKRLPDRRFGGAVGHQHDRRDSGRGRLFCGSLLHDRLERNELLAHPRRDRPHCARTVNDGEAHVIAALMPLHRHAIRLYKRRSRPTKRRHSGPARDVNDVPSHSRRSRIAARPSPPAPGPTKVSSPIASPSIETALSTPMVWASGALLATIVGCTRCSTPWAVRSATPRSLMRNPSSSAALKSASVMVSIPSTETAAASVLAPNAREARIASLCAVSKPPTSNVGSASA